MTNSPTTVDMSHPSRWLAVLRILVGLYFVKALWTKLDLILLGGVVPCLGVDPRWIEAMPQIVGRQAAENPILWYKDFLVNTVLANPVLFAKMIAWAETLVGLGLVFGFFTGLVSLCGFWLSLNYGLASQHMSPASFGFHYLLLSVMSVLFLARAGKAWGLDGWLAWRWPGAWFTWRPFA